MPKVLPYQRRAGGSRRSASHRPDASRQRRRGGRLLGRLYGFAALAAVAAFGLAATGALPSLTQLTRDPINGLVALWQPPQKTAAIRRPFPICGSAARVDCIVDGDTFWIAGEKVRIADIDTPEIGAPACRRERLLGEQAKRRLHQLMNAGPVELRRAGSRNRDRYGRLLRTVHRDGRSLGDILVAEGLARRWRGSKQGWCGPAGGS